MSKAHTSPLLSQGDQLVCALSQMPLYRRPKHQSEMLSEILFGETATVLELENEWVKLRCNWDDCEGWTLRDSLQKLNQDYSEKIFSHSYEWCHATEFNEQKVLILMGSPLMEFDGLTFNFLKSKVSFSGSVIQSSNNYANDEKVIKICLKYLSTPYKWGGRSPLGIDAPALIQMVLRFFDIHLPRTIQGQSRCGASVGFVDLAQIGDLVFFTHDVDKKYLSHVGIFIDDNRVIHAAEKVRIDRVDHHGIYNDDKKKYTHFVKTVRRVLE